MSLIIPQIKQESCTTYEKQESGFNITSFSRHFTHETSQLYLFQLQTETKRPWNVEISNLVNT